MNEHSGFFNLQHEDELDALKPYTKLIKNHFMTETDISKVLIEGDVATIMGVKYKRITPKKQETLYDIIADWWDDVFVKEGDEGDLPVIDDIVDRIEKWLPKEQSAAGSQNVYVECTVDGFNDCLHKIKNKLR